MASVDIMEEARKHIGSKPLPKIDPNTQEPESEKVPEPDLGNAIIPAVLVGFYKHTRNEEEASKLINENDSANILKIIFGDKKNSIIHSVADYANISTNNAENKMINTVSAIKEILAKEIKNEDGKGVSNFFTNQRSNILKHLPVELNMGELLEDSAIDDRTNKMEGPMSGLMHGIEKIFSSTK
ncbi:MAG: hypothetical protein ABI405_12030 [Parafilimonas sp.]